MYQIAVYVAIGNSDNKLTQLEWSHFCEHVDSYIRKNTKWVKVHGEWYSATNSQYQNACWSMAIYDKDTAEWLKQKLRETAHRYKQESILWAVADNNFLTAKEPVY